MHRFKLSRTSYLLILVLVVSLAVNISLVLLYPGVLSKIPSATSPQGTWYVDTLVAPENWTPESHQERMASGWTYQGLQYRVITDQDTDPDVDYEGQFYVYSFSVHNIWTDAGMNRTQHKLGNPSLVSGNNNEFAQYVSVHTSLAPNTCAYTSTSLANEASTNGLSRAAGTFAAGTASSGDVRWNQTKSFSVTGTTTGINATGLFYASSAGVLMACGQFAPTNVANGDTLQVRHSSNMTNVRWSYYGLVFTVAVLGVLTGSYVVSRSVRTWVRMRHG